MKKRRNWIVIAFGVTVLLVFIGIGVIIAIAAWFQQNVTVEQSSGPDAHGEFDVVRRKFQGRAPLLEMRDGTVNYSANRSPGGPSPPSPPLERLHVLVWDPDEARLASFSIPFWILRLKSTPIQLSSYASGMVDHGVDLRPDDIEKYGPGIVLETTSRSGDHVLVWAQ